MYINQVNALKEEKKKLKETSIIPCKENLVSMHDAKNDETRIWDRGIDIDSISTHYERTSIMTNNWTCLESPKK